MNEQERARKLVNVLGKEKGERAEKLRWLEKNLLLIESEAAASFGAVDPTAKALNAKSVSLVIRYWRRELTTRSVTSERWRCKMCGRKCAAMIRGVCTDCHAGVPMVGLPRLRSIPGWKSE